MSFACAIRRLRLLNGQKQQEIADALGMSLSCYSRLETGDRQLYACELPKLAAAMHIPVATLLEKLLSVALNEDYSANVANTATLQVSQRYIHHLEKQVAWLQGIVGQKLLRDLPNVPNTHFTLTSA